MRGNTVATLLTHMADANDILTDSINSQGVALEEYQHYLNSIEGKWQGLSTSAQAFASAAIDDSTIKGFLDLGTGFLNVLTDIIKQFGTLQTIIPIVFGALSAFKNVGIFTTMNDQLTGATGKLGIFGRTLSQINNDLSKGKFASLFHLVPKSEITALQSYGQALLSNSNKIKNWDKALAKGKINQQTYNQTIENTVGSLKGLSTTSQLLGIKIKQLHSDFLAGKMSASEFTMQVNTLIGAQKAATVATQVLGTALRTAFNIGIGIAIGAIISWIQDLITENQRMAEISKQAADEIKDELNGLEDYSEKIISLRKELESTNTTTERATDVRQELYDIQKDLIENYGAEKDSIDLVTGSIKDQIEELKNLGKQKYDSQYYSNYQATQATLGNLNNLDLVLDDRAWRDYANQMWQNSNASRFRDDVQDYMKSVLESAGFKYEGGFYKLDGNAFDVNDALVSVEKQVEQAINSLDINDYPNPAAYADAEKQLRHVLEYLSAVNKDVTSPLIEHEEELAQYIKYNEKYSEQYWKLFTARANYEAAQERGIQEEIIAARKAFIDTYNGLVIDEGDNAVSWWFEKEFGDVTNESEKVADTTVKNLYPVKESLNELSDALDGVYESFDSAFSNQSTIQSAFDKIQSGTDLTASEMRGLIKLCKKDFPEIGSLFTKTAKGYTISADDLIRANNAIMNSVKETVESQIKGYQEIIDAWENRKYDDKGFAENLGITEAEYNDAKRQIENLERALDTLGLSLDNSTDKLEEYNKVLKSISANLATGVSAQKEMNESGKISASTLESLLSLGEDYIKCITIENGIIKFNAEEYKKLEKAKIDDKIATIELTEAEIIYNRNQAAMYGNSSRVDELNALLADEQAKRKLLESLRDNYDTDWTTALTDKTSKNDDPIKDAFQKRQKELEHLLNMEQITEAEYYKQLFDSKEYKALLADRTKYADELNSIDEKFYKFQQDKYKEDADKQFDDLDEQFKAGKISAEDYAKALADLGNSLYGEGTLYAGTETAKKELESLDKKVKEVIDDIYSEFKEKLGDDGDLSLDNVLKDAEKLSKKNVKLFSDDPKTLKKNAEDIFSAVADSAKDALDKMLITPERYLEIIDEWGKKLEQTEGVISKAKELSESDYLDAWDLENGFDSKNSEKNFSLREKRVEYMFKLADKLYGKNGQRDIKAWNELVKQAFEEQKSILEDQLDLEKEYWEDRKDAKIKEFEEEIKRLESIQDEEEKINKAEELRLNLIKARNNLEQAKNNRNQLVFHNGTFEYMSDQEAVMSAQEEMSEAVKEIKDNELQQQIDILKEQKDNAEEFYDKIIEKIDGYLDDVSGELSSNSDVLDIVFGKDNKVIQTADELEKSNMWENMGEWNLENIIKALGGKPTVANMANFMLDFASNLVGKQIMPTSLPGGTTNNSNNVTNNATKVINLGGISVKLELAVQSLDDFVNNKIDTAMTKLGNAIEQEMPKILAKA